ncbi:MAG: right-handed parallel beta-helix repeat-containing protein [Bacteroidales bacterium]|nr:right-handed parallel beta-helix repeat-containing protein [Bacteroidales bacterium]
MNLKHLCIAAGALLASLQLSAREWVVATSGSDVNPGTFDAPFASIQKACALAKAGDTVTLRGGIYNVDEQIRPVNSGKPGAWIVYRSMPGEKAIIDGSRIQNVERQGQSVAFSRLTEGIVQIENVSYIKMQDINVRNSYAGGFILRGGDARSFDPGKKSPTYKIVLENCTSNRSHNSGVGVWYADSVLVTGCEIIGANDLDYRVRGVERRGEAPHEAISVCGARWFEISHNHLHDCHKEGIDCKEVSRHGIVHNNLVHDIPRQAYYVDAWFGLLEDIELYNNTAYNCCWGFAVSVEGKDSDLRNIRFHHNLIYNMEGAGVLFGMWGSNRLRKDIHIYNNTFYKCGSPNVFSGGVGSIDILSQNFKDVFIYRNICDKGWDYEFGFNCKREDLPKSLQEKNFIAKENLVEGLKGRPSRVGQFDAFVIEYLPEGNKIGVPLYRDELGFDFVPEQLPEVEETGTPWKYAPSPWYGAFKPEKTY